MATINKLFVGKIWDKKSEDACCPSTPNDLETLVAATGGQINNGDTSITIIPFIKKRIRFFRNKVKQSTIDDGTGSYYSWNPSSGTIIVTPAASTGELFQIEPY
jgi:hypothetical protein